MHPNRWKILHVVNLGTFIATLDMGIVNLALPRMGAQFAVTLAQIQWVVTCYLLTMVALLPVMGKLSDKVGRDKIYSGGFLLFGVGSLMAALSGGLAAIIVSRCVQGVGATMIMANSQAMVRQTFPDHERGRALGLNAVIISVGTLSGPSIGGLLLAYTGWEGLFLINVPLGIIGLIFGLRLFPRFKQVLANRLDIAGSLIMSSAAVLLILAAEGGSLTIKPWILIVAAFLLLAILLPYEIKIRDGIIDLELFTNRKIVIGNASAFLIHLVQMAALIPITFYLQNELDYDPWAAGLILGLQPLFMGIAAPVSGWYRDRFGAYSPLVAGSLLAAGSMLIIAIQSELTVIPIIIHSILIGGAMGLFQSTNNAEIMTAAPEQKVSQMGSMLALIRYMGMIAGIGAAAALVGQLGSEFDNIGFAAVGIRLQLLFTICTVCSLIVTWLIMWGKRRA